MLGQKQNHCLLTSLRQLEFLFTSSCKLNCFDKDARSINFNEDGKMMLALLVLVLSMRCHDYDSSDRLFDCRCTNWPMEHHGPWDATAIAGQPTSRVVTAAILDFFCS